MGVFGPVRINQPIEIEVKLDSGNRVYRSRVEGIADGCLIVAAPMVSGKVLPIIAGAKVSVSYLDNIALYTFDSQVVTSKLKPIPTLSLDRPTDVKRVQRRNFVRMDARLDLEFRLMSESLEAISENYSATTIDLSGGGLMFSTEHPLNLNDLLQIRLFFPDGASSLAIGKVVRIIEKKQTLKACFSIGLEFTVIEEGERDKIIRFIFNQQRELRRRGLL